MFKDQKLNLKKIVTKNSLNPFVYVLGSNSDSLEVVPLSYLGKNKPLEVDLL